MMMGRPPGIVSNDHMLPLLFFFWYLIHYVWGVHDFLNGTLPKTVYTLLAAMFRVHSCCNITVLATTLLSPGPYYPIPAIGPVVIGTLAGCLGMFLPADKGLSPISSGTPWAVQQAFLTAFFYHFMVHDKSGFVGGTVRAILGQHEESAVRVLLVTLAGATAIAQSVFNPEANFLTPFHKLLYLIFQVNGTPLESSSSSFFFFCFLFI